MRPYVPQSAATRLSTQAQIGVAATQGTSKSLQAVRRMTLSSNHPGLVGLARTAVASRPYLESAMAVISISDRCSLASSDLAADQDRAAWTACKTISRSDLLH